MFVKDGVSNFPSPGYYTQQLELTNTRGRKYLVTATHLEEVMKHARFCARCLKVTFTTPLYSPVELLGINRHKGLILQVLMSQ